MAHAEGMVPYVGNPARDGDASQTMASSERIVTSSSRKYGGTRIERSSCLLLRDFISTFILLVGVWALPLPKPVIDDIIVRKVFIRKINKKNPYFGKLWLNYYASYLFFDLIVLYLTFFH